MAFNFFGGKRRITKGFFANSFGNKQTRGVYTFEIDVENGEIIHKKYFTTPTDPYFSFNYGRFVCTTYRNRTGGYDDGGICQYSATSGLLALVARVTDKGKTYVHACANGDDETATKVYCVDYYNSELVTIGLVKKKLVKIVGRHKFSGKGLDPIKQNQAYPTYVGFIPNTQKVYCVCYGLDKVYFFDMNEDGHLTLDNVHSLDLEPGSGPKMMVFNDKVDRAYILNQLTSTVSVYSYKDGEFELIQTVDTYPRDEEENNTPTCIAFNSDYSHCYISNDGHDSLVLFSVDDDGKLSYEDYEDTSYQPIDLLVFNEEGNEWVVACCQKGSSVESYQYKEEKSGKVIAETGYGYMVSEPVKLVPFISKV